MDYTQIIREIDNLKQTILLVDDTVKHDVSMFWVALGIGLALIGLMSTGWIRYFVAGEVRKRLNEILGKYDPVTPTLLNGWSGDNVHYWKDKNGFVILDGVVTGGISGKMMMTFPTEYRPLKELKVPLICSEGFGYCVIGIDGSVSIQAHPKSWVRFGNIKFLAGK